MGGCIGKEHNTQNLNQSLGGSGEGRRKPIWWNGKNVSNMTLDELLAEMSKCKPDCTCTGCRPDLDLKHLREDGLVVQVDGKDYVRYCHDNLEVFTVKFLDYIGTGGRVRGNMRIPLIYGDYKLFGPDTAGPPCIEIGLNGQAVLADADCSLSAADCLDIFFKLQKCDAKEPSCEMNTKESVELLFNPFTEPEHRALCKKLETELGPVEITFAILKDAVPARVEVCLLDWPLEQDSFYIHGNITVGNKGISDQNSVSYLFQKPCKSGVLVRLPLEKGSGVPLPLSKYCTSVSRYSALQISIELKGCLNKRIRWIAQDLLEFSVNRGGSERQVIQGNDIRLAVTVSWTPDKLISFEERTKNFARMRAAKNRVADQCAQVTN